MMQDESEKLTKIFERLSEIGELHYKAQYRTGKLNWGAVGRAVSAITSNAVNILSIAYDALEDWNHHDICAVLDFICPALHPAIQDSPAVEWLSNLERVKRLMNSRGAIRVFTNWDQEAGKYNVATYRLVVTLERIDSQEAAAQI